MNQAWKALDKYSRESLTVADMKQLEEDVNELMKGWREEHDMGMHTYPQQAVNMGAQPPPDAYLQGVKFEYEMLKDQPFLVDRATIRTSYLRTV